MLVTFLVSIFHPYPLFMCTFNSFMASAKSFASGLKHNQNGRGRNGNLFEHVKAARPNGSGIFEHPRQMHISLGTFTSLGNLPNLKVFAKRCELLPGRMDLGGFFNQKTMQKKTTASHPTSQKVTLSIDLCHWGFRPHQELFASKAREN